MTKVCVIGAGASGLTAAICAAGSGADVTVLEHKPSAAGKLRLTGNGRCNFTNRVMDASCYHTGKDSPLAHILDRFGTDEAIAFIESLGVKVHERYGYYYPEDDNAGTVADALAGRCGELGVRIEYSCPDFIPPEELFRKYDALILAAGGRSYKKTGSNGSGYRYLEALGIPYTWIMPALSALRSDDIFLKQNAGRRLISTVIIYEIGSGGDRIPVASDTGEVQINEGSLSGIPVMNLSRYVSEIFHKGSRAAAVLELSPDEEKIPLILKDRYSEEVRNGNRIHSEASAGVELEISGVGKIDKAQVVRGGVELERLTGDLMVRDTSKISDGKPVFVIGEMCDVDGICGGYNLHWAWASGCIAGRASAGL